MKRVKRIILLTIIMAGYTTLVLSQNLDSMPKIKRDSILIAKAKECVLRYGAGYYREYKAPVIEEYFVPGKGTENITGEDAGRKMYNVFFPYDTIIELLEEKFAAKAAIWADTGVPAIIWFGNGLGVITEAKTEQEREELKIMQIEYQQRNPMIMYEFDENGMRKNPTNISMEELKRRGFEEIDGQWVKTKEDVPPNIDILKREGYEEVNGRWVKTKKEVPSRIK
jgi:hypothetical protein